MTPESVKTLIDLLEVGITSVNSFWSIYSIVVFALLGYVFSASRPMRAPGVRMVLALVFIFFAVANLRSIIREQYQAIAVSRYVEKQFHGQTDTEILAENVREHPATNPVLIYLFHVALDIAVVFVILIAPVVKREKKGIDAEATT